MKATILIRPKHQIPDFEGDAIKKSIIEAGYSEVSSCRIGRIIDLELNVTDDVGLEKRLISLSKRILAHPQTEDFKILEIREE